MKQLLQVLIIFMVAHSQILDSKAQAPQAFPYQAVARNNVGNLLPSQNITLRFSILDGSSIGILIYQETQNTTTNSLGLFNLNIGQGTVLSGNFNSINWGSGSKFLRVELDGGGGNVFTTMGTTQLLSVPYALYANVPGVPGPQGLQGLTGATGPAGTNGQTVLNGTVVPAVGLGTNGDFYINTLTSELFGPKSAGVWGTPISLIGPTGATGLAGTNGKTVLNGTVVPVVGLGTNGDFYINTITSELFGPKSAGVWGTPISLIGPTGAIGLAGTNGKTVLNGTVVPAVGIGTNGDFYINTLTSGLFGPKSAGVWGTPISLIGPTGATGLAGINGKTVLNGTVVPVVGLGTNGDFYINTITSELFGPKSAGVWGTPISLIGPTGAIGLAGTNGKTVLNGTVVPAVGIGTNGDFYINTLTSELFGPKSAGVWGAPISLIGPTGATGLAGTNGKTVLNGTVAPLPGLGTNGDFYINTATSQFYGPKTTGAWGSPTSLIGSNGATGAAGSANISGSINKLIKFTGATSGGNSILFDNGTSVGVGTITPSISSVVDMSSNTKGLLIPRMTYAQRNAIATPAEGLLIYQTDSTSGFYYFAGLPTLWQALKASNPWLVGGNNGSNSLVLGTNTPTDLSIQVDGKQVIQCSKEGPVGFPRVPIPGEPQWPDTSIHDYVTVGEVDSPGTAKFDVCGQTNSDKPVIKAVVKNPSAQNNIAIQAVSKSLTGWGYGLKSEGGRRAVYALNDALDIAESTYGVYSSSTAAGGVSDTNMVRYGVYSSASGGAFGTRYGIYGTASGGDPLKRYAGYFLGNMKVTGSIDCAILNQSSDRKLKQKIAKEEHALEQLIKLEPSTYLFKNEYINKMGLPSGKQHGLIAQDVETIFPELVSDHIQPAQYNTETNQLISEEIKYKGINYIGFVPLLIQSLKEQQEQLAMLKSENDELKSTLLQINKKLETLMK